MESPTNLIFILSKEILNENSQEKERDSKAKPEKNES